MLCRDEVDARWGGSRVIGHGPLSLADQQVGDFAHPAKLEAATSPSPHICIPVPLITPGDSRSTHDAFALVSGAEMHQPIAHTWPARCPCVTGKFHPRPLPCLVSASVQRYVDSLCHFLSVDCRGFHVSSQSPRPSWCPQERNTFTVLVVSMTGFDTCASK